ncbi:hypothetical protein PV721_08500 [Streptomyces sp. MB09-01]|nr:hypothetical protein [Streptomyces sp. MB09-01]MDX3534405.1 hypothetical protein [Streptomyces sp. MB09-01]
MSRIATARDGPAEPADDQPPPRDGHAFLGHPRGLGTLSGLEVWERFSFLGMQTVLVLYFSDTVAGGGLGMSRGTAASESVAYGTMVHLVAVAGGWLADRILGSYRAVLATLLAAAGRLTTARFVDLLTLVSVIAPVVRFAVMFRRRRVTGPLALANGIRAQAVKTYGQVSNPVHVGLNGAVAVAAGLAVFAPAPWLRRTMHPVH